MAEAHRAPDDVSVDSGHSKAEGVRKGRDFADQSKRARVTQGASRFTTEQHMHDG